MVLTNFVKTGAMPFLASATALVRRFLPHGTSDHDAMCNLPYRGRLWILIHGIPPARTLPISTQSFIVQLDAAAPRHLIACQGA